MGEVPGVGPAWTPINPSAGSFFHADTHIGEPRPNSGSEPGR
jgi:hypothetical protein